jgi:nitrile hydratase
MKTLPDIATPAIAPPYPLAAPAHFLPGDPVRVRAGAPPGHIRTPWYLRGRAGRVERVLGAFANPEELAYPASRPGAAPVPLYRVRFAMAELWGDGVESPADTLDAEVFEHWLETADAA